LLQIQPGEWKGCVFVKIRFGKLRKIFSIIVQGIGLGDGIACFIPDVSIESRIQRILISIEYLTRMRSPVIIMISMREFMNAGGDRRLVRMFQIA